MGVFNCSLLLDTSGPGSSVGIATDYGLDGRGSNPGGDEIFRPSRPDLGNTQPPVQWVRVFPGSRGGRGVGLTPPTPSSAEGPRKSRAISLLTLRTCVAYKKSDNVPITRHQGLHNSLQKS